VTNQKKPDFIAGLFLFFPAVIPAKADIHSSILPSLEVDSGPGLARGKRMPMALE